MTHVMRIIADGIPYGIERLTLWETRYTADGSLAVIAETASGEHFIDVSVHARTNIGLDPDAFILHHALRDHAPLVELLRPFFGEVEHTSIDYGQGPRPVWRLACIAQGKGFRFEAREGLVRATFPEDPSEEVRAELAAFGFGWSGDVNAWVRLDGTVGREVAWSLARSWREAERAREADEPPDPRADIIESTAENDAVNTALDEAKRRYVIEGERSTLAQIVAENAGAEYVIDFIREAILPLGVGESATFNGGAGGEFTFKRVE